MCCGGWGGGRWGWCSSARKHYDVLFVTIGDWLGGGGRTSMLEDVTACWTSSDAPWLAGIEKTQGVKADHNTLNDISKKITNNNVSMSVIEGNLENSVRCNYGLACNGLVYNGLPYKGLVSNGLVCNGLVCKDILHARLFVVDYLLRIYKKITF